MGFNVAVADIIGYWAAS